jgi:DNA polymerase-3 subunit gamma/tau
VSYQVIARKYRPQRFSDVVGQEHVTQTLANAIQQNRIAHAYLFCGPRGTGKTTIARIFAKCLNCTGGPKVDFDNDDPRCREITEGRSLDVLEIDGASNRGIEEIRELRETVKYAPASSKFKIYIIDEVHMLTKEAFNALLKTLEEPPAHVKFMFATTEPEKVLPTILSRCQRFDLRRIPSALIMTHLKQIAKQEKVQIDDAALDAVARGADGAMRDAESTLDQLISFCGGEIVEADVLSMFGLTSRSQILSLTGAVLAGEIGTALRELNDLSKNGKDLSRLLSDLLNHFRNLLIYQVSGGDLKLLEASEAEAAALAEQCKGVTSEALTRIMEVLAHCEGRFRDAASKKILIEISLLKAIEARSAVDIDSVLEQLQQLRNGSPGANIAVSAIPTPAVLTALSPQTNAIPVPVAPAPVLAKADAVASNLPVTLAENVSTTPANSPESDAKLEELWALVVEAVGRVSPFTRTYLLEAHPVSFDKNIFTIGFDPEFADHLGLVDNSKNRTLIQTKLNELGQANIQVRFVQAPAPENKARRIIAEPEAPLSPAPANVPAASRIAAESRRPPEKPGPAKLDPEEFKNDPLIKQALEIFKGQIVEVRA